MGKDFHFVIDKDSQRAPMFLEIFGRLDVNIKSPVREIAKLPDFDEPQEVYYLDLELLSEDDYYSLIDYLMSKFLMLEGEIQENLDNYGMPILASEGTLVIQHPGRWF